MTAPKKTDPLTRDEVVYAAEAFFRLFEVVLGQAPAGTSVEDAIKLSESIFAYAHKLRAIDAEANSSAPFGFNKGDSTPPAKKPNEEFYDSLPFSDARRWTYV